MTASEYVRRSVIDRLRADGIDPSGLALQSEGGGSVAVLAAGGPGAPGVVIITEYTNQ
jgi:hypothetical protein